MKLIDRVGLWLFALYLGCYAGFVGLAAFRADLMALTPWRGINVATLYGFGLIVLAFILAMVYGFCRVPRAEDRT